MLCCYNENSLIVPSSDFFCTFGTWVKCTSMKSSYVQYTFPRWFTLYYDDAWQNKGRLRKNSEFHLFIFSLFYTFYLYT